MNPNIILQNTQGTPIMSPYELAGGLEIIKNNRLTNQLTMRKMEQQQRLAPLVEQQQQVETETAKLANAIQKGAYVAQSVQGFLDQPVTPETQAAWQQTRAQIINDVGHDIPNLPQQFDPMALKSAYSQGMSTIKNLADRYKLISTTQGFKRVDMLNNQAEDIGGQQLMAPNADPRLAGQMQFQKERRKGVKMIGPNQEEYYAPQGQINNAFNIPDVINGISNVESGGEYDPATATNPYSSAYGATQVLEGTQQDSGFPMPPFPKNGTAEQQKAWSATLYNHYLRIFGGDHNKAVQAWHDGVGAVQQGRPDKTGYVGKVASALGNGIVTGPTIQQKNKAEIEKRREFVGIENQQKLEQAAPEKEKGQQMFTDILNKLEGAYDELNKSNAIANPEKNILSNLSATTKSSDLGQYLGQKTGSKDQSLRNTILSAKPLLSQAIMKATGMSSKQLDSNVELQMFMKSATDPQSDYKSVKEQIGLLRQLYSGGNTVNANYNSNITRVLNGKTYTKINGKWHENE